MNHLTKALKTILNGLAMQYERDYLSDEDKKANLQRVLAEIEQERKNNTASATISSAPASSSMALNTK